MKHVGKQLKRSFHYVHFVRRPQFLLKVPLLPVVLIYKIAKTQDPLRRVRAIPYVFTCCIQFVMIDSHVIYLSYSVSY